MNATVSPPVSPAGSQGASQSPDRYRALFEAQPLPAGALGALRRAALARFLESGFPTQRDEAWKYTNLRRLETRSFGRADAETLTQPVGVDESRWIPVQAVRTVLLNGRWAPHLSGALPQPPGVTVLALSQWLEHAPEEAAEFLQRHAPAHLADPRPNRGAAFEHLNQAFASDGIVIEVTDGTVCDLPLYLVHHWSVPALMSHPRIIVRAGRNTRCTLIEHYVGTAGDAFTNAVTTVEADSGAQLVHYRIQQEAPQAFHMGHTQVTVAADATYTQYELAFGAALSRAATHVSLRGTGAAATLMGLIMPSGNQHLDSFTCIEHAAAHTTSRELYRGIAEDRGRAVVRGKVIVQPDAQHIDAQQSNRNLLLSPLAEIDTRPELEIYANDVKCSHGATTGQLDATALFYLRSRGLSEAQARAMLIRAFAEGFVSQLQQAAVAHFLEQHLAQRFANLTEAA
jgi:Fe-S cluster assembly protein SufD